MIFFRASVLLILNVFPLSLAADTIEKQLASLGGSAWDSFICVRFADEAQGGASIEADGLFQRAAIGARAFLTAYSDQLIGGEAIAENFESDERRFLFGPNVEFKLGAMVTLASLHADAMLDSKNGERQKVAEEAWRDFMCERFL